MNIYKKLILFYLNKKYKNIDKEQQRKDVIKWLSIYAESLPYEKWKKLYSPPQFEIQFIYYTRLDDENFHYVIKIYNTKNRKFFYHHHKETLRSLWNYIFYHFNISKLQNLLFKINDQQIIKKEKTQLIQRSLF